MTKNQLEYRAQDEIKRANLAREAETQRYNLVLERLKDRELSEQHSRFYDQLAETKRSNIAKELETARSNQAREAETERSNRASLDEVSRHNIVSEENERSRIGVSLGQLQESVRSNQANEAIRQESNRISLSELQERRRSNLASEQELRRSNQAREYETHRSNLAVESERSRSNQANERLESRRIHEVQRSNIVNQNLDRSRYNLDNYVRTNQLEVNRGTLTETKRNNVVNNIVNGISAAGKLAGVAIRLFS